MPAEPFKFDGILTPFKAKIVEKFSGDSVLDVGCNDGELVNYLKSVRKEVVGIDTDEKLIAEAKRKYPTIEFKKADAESLPYEDNSFDTCVAWNILEHVEDDKKGFRELLRVARKNVILTVPREDEISIPSSVTYRHYVDPTHKQYYSEKNLKELIAGEGERIIHLELVSRVSPLLAYAKIGIPMILCKVLDKIFWIISPKKEAFLSVWLVVVEKREISQNTKTSGFL